MRTLSRTILIIFSLFSMLPGTPALADPATQIAGKEVQKQAAQDVFRDTDRSDLEYEKVHKERLEALLNSRNLHEVERDNSIDQVQQLEHGLAESEKTMPSPSLQQPPVVQPPHPPQPPGTGAAPGGLALLDQDIVQIVCAGKTHYAVPPAVCCGSAVCGEGMVCMNCGRGPSCAVPPAVCCAGNICGEGMVCINGQCATPPAQASGGLICGGGMVAITCGGRTRCAVPPAVCCGAAVCGEGMVCMNCGRGPSCAIPPAVCCAGNICGEGMVCMNCGRGSRCAVPPAVCCGGNICGEGMRCVRGECVVEGIARPGFQPPDGLCIVYDPTDPDCEPRARGSRGRPTSGQIGQATGLGEQLQTQAPEGGVSGQPGQLIPPEYAGPGEEAEEPEATTARTWRPRRPREGGVEEFVFGTPARPRAGQEVPGCTGPGCETEGSPAMAAGSWSGSATFPDSKSPPPTLSFSIDSGGGVSGSLSGDGGSVPLKGKASEKNINMSGSAGSGDERISVSLQGRLGAITANGTASLQLGFSREELKSSIAQGVAGAIAGAFGGGSTAPGTPKKGGEPMSFSGTWTAQKN